MNISFNPCYSTNFTGKPSQLQQQVQRYRKLTRIPSHEGAVKEAALEKARTYLNGQLDSFMYLKSNTGLTKKENIMQKAAEQRLSEINTMTFIKPEFRKGYKGSTDLSL